jgi:hypothetical protein
MTEANGIPSFGHHPLASLMLTAKQELMQFLVKNGQIAIDK